MKITDVEAFEVDVPWNKRVKEYMLKLGWVSTRRFIYKVHTDEGITGLGDGGDARELAKKLIGRNPFEFILDDTCGPLQPAVYDIMGKALGLPVCKLFGPMYRDKVPVLYWSGCISPEALAREAEVALSNGFTVHKMKARPWFDPVEQVDAMSKVVPSDFSIVVDANCSFWLPSKAVKVGRKLERYNVFCLESPIPQTDVEGYITIRNKVDIPVAMHMGAGSGTILSPATVIEKGMCDYFVIEEPGAAGTLKLASIAENAGPEGGRPLFVEFVGSGIMETFGLHVAAAIKNATLPSCTLVFSQYLFEDDLLVEGIRVKDGCAELPKGPGLGVTLDEAALKRYLVK